MFDQLLSRREFVEVASSAATFAAASMERFVRDNVPFASAALGGANRVVRVTRTDGVEWRCYEPGGHHVMSVIYLTKGGILAYRPHPSLDVNAWGSTVYPIPFLANSPGPTLSTMPTVTADASGIQLKASGLVARGVSASYGSWSLSMTFSFATSNRRLSGSGIAKVNLSGTLAKVGSDLNLFRVASNYLVAVPRVGASVGDTGDCTLVRRTYKNPALGSVNWVPSSGTTYPQERAKSIELYVEGALNNVDTEAMGYAAIAVAKKPSISLSVVSLYDSMFVGLAFDRATEKAFWADNVAAGLLIGKNQSSLTKQQFSISFSSTP